MSDSSANLPELKWVNGVAQVPPLQPTPAPAAFREKKPTARGPWAAIGSVILLGLGKLKLVLLSLKALSLGKLALSSGSMFVMIWFMARRDGWPFGVGFVLLLLLHELGHAFAIQRVGLKASWPVFIPFFGAMITLKEQPRSANEEAIIAYGGPLVGTVASCAAAGVYLVTGERLYLSLAFTGFFLNLFNLVPIRPLDGGRVAQAFSRQAWVVGLVLLAAMFYFSHAPQLLLIGFLALTQAFSKKQQAPSALTTEQQAAWAVKYFGLVLFLGAGMYFANELLKGGGAP